MRVRTRLLLAFAYILLVVVIALEIPFAINLNRRALREEENRVLTLAQATADGVELSGDLANLGDKGRLARLQRYVDDQRESLQGGRLLVTDSKGLVLADTGEPSQVGVNYASRPEIAEILRPGGPAFATDRRFSDTLAQEILTAAAAVHGVAAVDGIVRISVSLEGVNAEVRRIVAGTAAIGLAGLIAGLVIAWIVAGQLSRPLRRLAGAARRLGEGDLEARSGATNVSGEMGEVARTFDAMADRLQRTVTAQREFVANASHQLRTPLTGMKLRLESAAEDAPTEDLRRQIKAAEHEADRLAAIVERLLVMARSVEEGETSRQACDLGMVARTAAERWEERAAARGGSVSASGDGVVVAASEEDLAQIVDNLVDNALAYAPGPVRIEAGRAGGRAVLAVQDSGPGIPEEERGRVMERFYRGAGSPAGGSGLGLAIVRDLAGRWDGEVAVLGAAGGGTRVEVRLPLS